MLRNMYTTNINNEVLSLSFGHGLKKHAGFDVPGSDRNNTQFKTPIQDRFFVFNTFFEESVFMITIFFRKSGLEYYILIIFE